MPRFGVSNELEAPASNSLLRARERRHGVEYPRSLRELFLGVSRSVFCTWVLPVSLHESLPQKFRCMDGGGVTFCYRQFPIDRPSGTWINVFPISVHIYWKSDKREVWVGGYRKYDRIPQELDDFLVNWFALGFIDKPQQLKLFINKRTKKLDSNGANGRRWREIVGLP